MPDDPRVRHHIRGGLRRLGFLPAQTRIAETLGAFAASLPEVFFLQIGANDATHGDPLRWIIREWGWRGVMLEPVPHIFNRLRQSWGNQRNLTFVNAALGDSDGERDFYSPRPDDNPRLPPWYDQIGSFHRGIVLKDEHRRAIPDLELRVERLRVRCLTFDSLCREFGVDRSDLIHIDAEGADWEILSGINLSRFQAKLILFEHKHLEPDTYDQALRFLHGHGFAWFTEGPDTLAMETRCLERIYPSKCRKGWQRDCDRPHSS